MIRTAWKCVGLLAVGCVFLMSDAKSQAQVVVVQPRPILATPIVSVYAPRPVVSYYAAPRVAYYADPAPVYYAPRTAYYYAPPAVSYYQPAPVTYARPTTTVTTYRPGILPWRVWATTTTYVGP